jgi:phospholipase D1/2
MQSGHGSRSKRHRHPRIHPPDETSAVSEHLDCTPAEVAKAGAQKERLIGVAEGLLGEGRSLRPLDCTVAEEMNSLVPDSGLTDPPEPFSPDHFVGE